MFHPKQSFVVGLLSFLGLLIFAGCATPPQPEQRKILYIASTKDAPDGALVGKVGEGRPDELKPGAIPKRVRYKAVEDERVVRCANLLRESLTTGENKIFGDFLMMFPGAWSDMKRIPGLNIERSTHASFPRDNGRTDDGRIFKENAQGGLFLAHMIRVVEKNFKIRALTTDELARWWIYIPFDIEEPIFILQSEDSTRRYIVSFNDEDKVSLLDELSFYH